MKQRESAKLKESAANAKQEPRDHHLRMKQRESAKLKESAANAKQEPRDHHQSRYSKC